LERIGFQPRTTPSWIVADCNDGEIGRLIFLPPYSSKLNPIDRFWEDLKDHLAFDLHQTLSELNERGNEKLLSYTGEAVASQSGAGGRIR